MKLFKFSGHYITLTVLLICTIWVWYSNPYHEAITYFILGLVLLVALDRWQDYLDKGLPKKTKDSK